MKALFALGFALVLLTLGSGCEDNWQSFYIEEVKALSDPPECVAPAVENSSLNFAKLPQRLLIAVLSFPPGSPPAFGARLFQ